MEKATDGLNRINTTIRSSGEIIDALGSRADDIGKIIEVIDDISEQTNLLALNAAIEAARAGEHGLGFAVVADEVRKLAEKSAQSTKEISELIQSIQKEARKAVENMENSTTIVNEGLNLGSELNAALRKISNVVTEVYKFAQEIGAATNEQSHGSSQIARATTRLNEITHEINSAVEEQASGATAVVKAMERMRELVRVVDVGFNGTGRFGGTDVEDVARPAGQHGSLLAAAGRQPVSATKPRGRRLEVARTDMSRETHIVGFQVGRETYGVPITSLHEIVRVPEITAVPDAPSYVEGVINLRGKIVSVVDLRKRFGRPAPDVHRRNRILVVEHRGRLSGHDRGFGFGSPEDSGERDRTAPAMMQESGLECITGLGKYHGRLIILLDVNKLLEVAGNSKEGNGAESAVSKKGKAAAQSATAGT